MIAPQHAGAKASSAADQRLALTPLSGLRPGQRLPVTGSREVAALICTFNEMLGRLERERGTSAARALSAQEAERRRIAQELHDEIGQSLRAVLLELKRAADRAPEPLQTDLREAQETTREGLNEVRRIARRLRPGVLEDLGLISALTALTTEFSTHTGLSIDRRFAPELPELGTEAELVLYRVAQESLTNIARHADARHVDVTLTTGADELELRICDDGRGLSAPWKKGPASAACGSGRCWSTPGSRSGLGLATVPTCLRVPVPISDHEGT